MPTRFFTATYKWKAVKKVTQILNRGLEWLLDYPNSRFVFRVRKALYKIQEVDLLISIAAPHAIHWGVALAMQKPNKIAKTWVSDCGDPYMGLELEKIKKPFYFAFIEKWAFRKADFITVPFEGAKKAYYAEFQSKIKVNPQGFDFSNLPFSAKVPNNKMPHFAYAGGLSQTGVRSPFAFLDMLLQSNIEFKFHIYSPNIDLVAKYAVLFEGKLILHRAINRQKLLPELAQMDFLLNFDNGVPTQMPSKLIDYALVNRPVLNSKATQPNKLEIEAFMLGNYRSAMQLPPLENFDIKRVTANFIKLSN